MINKLFLMVFLSVSARAQQANVIFTGPSPWFDLKAYAKGDGTADDYSGVTAAISSLTIAGGGTIFVSPGTYRIGNSISFPSNCTLLYSPGGVLSPDNGVTITINGPIRASDIGIFSAGQGAYSFGIENEYIGEYPAAWFGLATGNSATANTAALNKLAVSVPGGSTVRWNAGIYSITSFSWPNKRWRWLGRSTIGAIAESTGTIISGSGSPVINFSSAGANFSRYSMLENMGIKAMPGNTGLKIDNLGVALNNIDIRGGVVGIELDSSVGMTWNTVSVAGTSTGVYVNTTSPGAAVNANVFNALDISCGNSVGTALYISTTITAGSMMGNVFNAIDVSNCKNGIILDGDGALNNTFINPWAEAMSGSGAVSYRDSSNGRNIWMNIHSDSSGASQINPNSGSINYNKFNDVIFNNGMVAQSVPTVQVSSAADTSIANGTLTTLGFGVNNWASPATMHSTTTNTSRLVAPLDGKYLACANVIWAASATANTLRSHYFAVNGNLINGETTVAGINDGSRNTSTSICAQLRLLANDYVETLVFQNTGGALSINAIPGRSPYFSLTYLSQ